jgi:integrase
LKNLNSRRLVPVHFKLTEYGLKDYISLVKRHRSERLFPKLKFSVANRYSHQATKWFSRTFMKKLNLEGGNKSFHSFRHSMATVLQGSNVEEAKISELLGHAQQSITFARYGKGYAIQQLAEAVGKFKIT